MLAPKLAPQELRQIIDHVFLPPKLPQRKDEPRDSSLVATTLEALDRFRDVVSEGSHALERAAMALDALLNINSLPDGFTCQKSLEKALSTIANGDAVAVKIEAQNAAVMIARQDNTVIFEEFELSARNSDVVGTRGRLTRSFPGLAVAVDWRIARAADTDFCEAISRTIAVMSSEIAPSMQPRSKKKGHQHEEERDTTHPGLVSELLVGGILKGFGSAVTVRSISKQTRDEVLWDNAHLPWRRSAMWLLIRVVLQLTIVRAPDGSRLLYKEFMVFMMTTLLERSLKLPLESDVFHVMNTKISRRLHKIGTDKSANHDRLTAQVHAVLGASYGIIQHRWTTVQTAERDEAALGLIPTFERPGGAAVDIPALDVYIGLIRDGKVSISRSQFSPSSQLLRLEPESLPTLPDSHPSDYHYAVARLQQVEQWVLEHLSAWVTDRDDPGALHKLHKVLVQYHGLAEGLYEDNPEGTSIMLLTVFELWLACDRIARASCSFIEDYDPEIPNDILENLLLPSKAEMERLDVVERYLHRRRQHSSVSAAYLFDIHSERGFPALYFDSSTLHQSLLSTISAQAVRDRNQKAIEFDIKKGEYAHLMSLVAQREHEYVEVVTDAYGDYQEIETRHARNCQRCGLERQAADLSISVHEWPLPTDGTESKGVIFELRVPQWFADWREARQYLLVDVLKGEVPKYGPQPSYRLSVNDPHLSKSYYRQENGGRIGLLSEVKPNVVTHYSDKKIRSTTKHEVCLRNGLCYKYYDSGDGAFIGPVSFSDKMVLACTYRLPVAYRKLQRYLIRPATQPDGVAPNTVIASQDDCPDGMTLEEHKEFATIPLGRHIQWSHILLQLAMPEVDLRKPETYLVMLQCLYQAGPRSEHLIRQAHVDCWDANFIHCLIDQLRESLERIRENWDSLHALNLFVHITTRVLSLSEAGQERCLELLERAREIAMGWFRRLRERAYASQAASDRATFTARTAAIAMVCGFTFDLDEVHLQMVLRSSKAASTLIQCSILEQQGRSEAASDDIIMKLLTLQFKRILHRAHQALYENHAGLDDAVERIWSAFTPSAEGWQRMREATEWVLTYSVPKGANAAITVHFNAVSGELLVDGCPLDRPPQMYQEQPLYATLFGSDAVQVMPTQAMSGYSFCTLRQFGGLTVYLGMSSEDSKGSARLRVRATDGSRTFEVIPHELFETTYPAHFVDDYVHWYNFESGDIEFRPKRTVWVTHATDSLIMRLCETSRGRHLTRDNFTVLDLKHPHFKAISTALAPLAVEIDIHIRSSSSRIDVDVPKLRLGFFVERGTCRLISREVPSMEIAADQRVGTLVGLENKLVLQRRADGHRKLLLPEGPISYRTKGHHALVHLTRECMNTVHTLDIDDDLGRLIDSGSMRTKLLLAYLHALTSSCLPDPFTDKTGTEQALTILRSAAVRSCHLLTQGETDMLARISRLTPGRAYYPREKRVMESVSWDPNLSFLSQHNGFLAAAGDIYDQTRRASVFQIGPLPQFPDLNFADDHLIARDRIRSSSFKIAGFGAEDCTTDGDRRYEARDRSQSSKRAQSAALMSGAFCRGFTTSFLPVETREYIWSLLMEAARVSGSEKSIRPLDLAYNTGYLEDWRTYVSENWPAIHRWMRQDDNSRTRRFTLVTCLSTMAFSDTRDMHTLQALAMCANIPWVGAPEFYSVEEFLPHRGMDCTKSGLRVILNRHLLPFLSSPECSLERKRNESKHKFDGRRHSAFQSRQNAAVAAIVDQLLAQWRRKVPSAPTITPSVRVGAYVNVTRAMTEVRQAFQAWYDNGVLFQYLQALEKDISARPHEAVDCPDVTVAQALTCPSVPGFVAGHEMFTGEPPGTDLTTDHPQPLLLHQQPAQQMLGELQSFRLQSLIESLETDESTSEYETKYIEGLQNSLEALKRLPDKTENIKPGPLPIKQELLTRHLAQCRARATVIFKAVTLALRSNIKMADVTIVGQHPRLCPAFLIEQLSRHRWGGLTDRWRACIVAYGVALTSVQRAGRLIEMAAAHEDLSREIENHGHSNWDPLRHPESLLLELESGLIIREVQEEIAACMRTPPLNHNTTMQLHMGEGKTSMIVPMSATALADGTQLVRIIVAKPQSKQMAQMLTAKLGGLVNRRVYHMPISRDLRLDESAARSVAVMVHECRAEGGVLLVQPEHLLSLQLMAWEAHMSGKTTVFNVLMSLLTLFDGHARDIVDESDENFNVRLELIYTMGTQQVIEHSPGRWILFQRVLEIVRDIACELESTAPRAISVRRHVTGGFPRIRILRPEAGNVLIELLADRICERHIGGLPIATQPPALRRAIREYISCPEPADAVVRAVEHSNFWTESTKLPILLLRGLLGNGLLTYVLGQKRWRVNYGLATRSPPTRLAVPYRALDCPTPRSEFSHPDVVIVLTLLSYYYEGLSDDDLFAAFQHLMNSDAAELEFQAWIQDADKLPLELRQLQSINLKDKGHCVDRLFPALRYGKSVIDYFLAHHVFPKEMREFPSKLSASGWDIGRKTGQVLTGFSGTCDSRHLLPLDVHHVDLETQKHTNAMVLEHLLRPDNGVHLMLGLSELGDTSDAENVIAIAATLDPPVQVILDVGAQVLEMSNLVFATEWLKACGDDTKEAAVFINENDEICVVDRSERVDLLHTSPLVGRMNACLVFLDEAHTRGIDLRLPQTYRALVTMGPHLTKDRLVQACMRMRKLGQGQTVVFCLPEEVQDKIKEQMGGENGQAIQLADVLRWSISGSHTDIRSNIPLWAVQGRRFARHAEVWDGAFADPASLQSWRLLEDEAQTIEQRYLPRPHSATVQDHTSTDHPMRHQIAVHCQQFDGLHLSSRTLQEEQERELSPEAEQERQIQKPPAATPTAHSLHRDVVRFALDGTVLPDSPAYMPAFDALKDTSMAKSFDVVQFEGNRDLLVTADFVSTVQRVEVAGETNLFQRPVRWVLTRLGVDRVEVDRMMILSPYEANLLYPKMKDANTTTLHLYKPWCNATYNPIDRLDLHMVPCRDVPPSIPTSLAVQLSLFAGQLYLSTHEDYLAICRFLGLWTKDLTEEMEAAGWDIAADRFIKRDGDGHTGGPSSMQQSPVCFVRGLMSIRRGGQSISRTHMGSLLDGQPLDPHDFSGAKH